MTNIIVGRYTNPTTLKYWQGWIEPDDKTWIAFIDREGKPTFYLDRDPSGAVIEIRDDGKEYYVNNGYATLEDMARPDVLVRNSEDDSLDPRDVPVG